MHNPETPWKNNPPCRGRPVLRVWPVFFRPARRVRTRCLHRSLILVVACHENGLRENYLLLPWVSPSVVRGFNIKPTCMLEKILVNLFRLQYRRFPARADCFDGAQQCLSEVEAELVRRKRRVRQARPQPAESSLSKLTICLRCVGHREDRNARFDVSSSNTAATRD